MPTFLFTNAVLLAGLAALAIPVLIHLLLKRKKKRIKFSTIRFFKLQDEQSSRRRKLRNLFLLALRLLIVTLIVLAFARPYSRQTQASAAGRKQRRVVFVLDRSASMLATGTEGQRWKLAQAQIEKALSELSSDDSAALIEAATHANVLSGFVPPGNLLHVVRDLTPSYGTCSLNEGLREAVRLLSDRSKGASTIYVVSDFQKAGCRGSCPVPQDVELKMLPTGDLFSPNLAIIAMEPEAHEGVRPQATVASFSDETSSATLELSVDDQRISSQAITLKPGTVTNVDLIYPSLKPGWHSVTAFLRVKDALEADNKRFGSFWVPEPAQILVIEPRSSARSFEQETFFVTAALDPSKDMTNNSIPGVFKVTQITPEQLTGQIGPASQKAPWNVVVLPALKELPSGMSKALVGFVKAGGGLVLLTGEGMSANGYNSELAELLPARLNTIESSPEGGSPWRIALYDTNTLVFAAFRVPNSGDLHIPRFTQRFGLEPVEGSTRLAFFGDGVPLVIMRPVGKGKVVLINSSADTAWNDWPKHKTFVPFLHGLMKYCAQQPNHDALQDKESYIAGDDFEINTTAQGRLAEFALRGPDGQRTRLMADDHGRLRDPHITLPGVYSLEDKTAHEIRKIAINMPPEEANLEAVRAADFQQQIARVQENRKQTLAAGLFGSQNNQREFWQALLLGALMLLLVEPFIANRTSL